MKKETLPQDESFLANFTREVCYVKNEDGQYEQGLSTGWKVKAEALDEAWNEINRRIEAAAEEIKAGKKSPILFFMELNLMDMPTMAGYTEFFPFTIKWHMRPGVFKRLSDKKLQKYAKAFRISLDELKNFDGNNIEHYKQK